MVEATDRQRISGCDSGYPLIRFLSAAARGVIMLKGTSVTSEVSAGSVIQTEHTEQ